MSFLGQFSIVSFALKPCRSLSLLWDWRNICCEGRHFGGSWDQLIIQEAKGPDRLHPRVLREVTIATSLKHHGDYKCHSHLQWGQEEDPDSYKAHLYPWESYRAKLLGAIASYVMDKAAANIPSGFTKTDSGAVDKKGEDGKCCTLWLLDGLWFGFFFSP